MAKELEKGAFIRRGRAIFPVDEHAEAMVLALKEDKPFLGMFRGVRNIDQLRKWWKLMSWLSEHRDDLFPTKDAADKQLKLDTGHFDRVLNVRTGELREETRSIALESLPQREFNDLMNTACGIICRDFVPGLESEALRDEIYTLIDGPERSSLGKRVA